MAKYTRTFLLFFLSLFFITKSSTLALAHDRDEESTTHLAVLLDLEGGQSTLGRPAMNGFNLALQQAAARQASKIFTTFLNTQSDPAVTFSSAKQASRRVSIAAGFTDNDSVLIAGPLFQKKKVPFLSIGATDPSLPDLIGNRIFLAPFGDNSQAAGAAEFAKLEFGNTVAILFDNTSAYSRTLPQYFRTRFEELGGEVLLTGEYPGGCSIPSLGKEIMNLPSRPSFVYLAGLPDCIGEVVSSLRSSGMDLPILGGDGLDTTNFLVGDQHPTDNVWYTTHAWLSSETGTPKAKEFIVEYQEAYGSPPDGAFAALGYDAANLLLDVIRRAEKVRHREILEAFEETEGFTGVTGTISFSKDSHVPLKTVWTIRVTDGHLSLATAFLPEAVPPPLIDEKVVLR